MGVLVGVFVPRHRYGDTRYMSYKSRHYSHIIKLIGIVRLRIPPPPPYSLKLCFKSIKLEGLDHGYRRSVSSADN